MPKKTFLNLPQEKQQRILETCKKEFEEKPLFQASVSDIVNTLGIARGSFYQYFENLEECFFTILSSENMDVHALLRYGEVLSKELIEYTKAIVHNLISRFFIENWEPEEFIEHFQKQTMWMKNGLKAGN